MAKIHGLIGQLNAPTTPPKSVPAVFKVSELAARWGVADRQVSNFIDAGNLAAINIGIGSRKQWRITPEAVAHFEKVNSSLFDAKSGKILPPRPVPMKGGPR